MFTGIQKATSSHVPALPPTVMTEAELDSILLTTPVEEAHFTQRPLRDVLAMRHRWIGRPRESVAPAVRAHLWTILMCTFRQAERFTFIPREFFPRMITNGEIRAIEKDGDWWLFRDDWMADFKDHLARRSRRG